MRPVAKISSTKSNRKSGFTSGVNTYHIQDHSMHGLMFTMFGSCRSRDQSSLRAYIIVVSKTTPLAIFLNLHSAKQLSISHVHIYIYIYIYIYTYIIQKTHRALIFSSKHSPTGCIPRIFLPTIDTVVHSHSITVSPPSPGYESTRTGPRTNLKHTTIG
jgi:hypothetical protein